MFSNNLLHMERPWGVIVLLISLGVILFVPKLNKSKIRFNFYREHLPKKLGYISYLSILRKILLLGSYIFLSLAWMGISKEEKRNVIRQETQNIIFLLDISPSMSVEDVDNTSRWYASKQLLQSIVESDQNSKYAVIIFSNTIAYLVPFTDDINYIKDSVNSVYLGDLGEDTALADALAFAHNLYTKSVQNNPTKIVVFTDGNQNTGNLSLDEVKPHLSSINEDIVFIQFGSSSESTFTYNDRIRRQIITGTIKPSEQNLIVEFLSALDLSYFNYKNTSDLAEIISLLHTQDDGDIIIQELTVFKQDLTTLFFFISIMILLMYIMVHRIFLKALW